MALRRISCTGAEPVTLTEAKSHLRVDSTFDDDYITSLITVARELAENECKRSFVRQQWQLTLDDFPDGSIELPRPPLATEATSINITYYATDTAITLTTLASTDYAVDDRSEPAIIVTSTYLDGDWPDTNEQLNAVTVTYYAGYLNSTDIPKPVQQWIKMKVADMYEHRESVIVGNIVNSLDRRFYDGLLDPYRIITVI